MVAVAQETQTPVRSFHITKEIFIAAPANVVFQTLLQPLGPLKEMNLTLEPFPGGRWYRDLGNNTGHFWGHVQVIKTNKLLEITGPVMMSFPVSSFIQYRLIEQPGGTLLKFTHQALGLIPPGTEDNLTTGWQLTLEAIQSTAEKK